ncbi:hypothetical protein ABIA25_005686 [Sinorhizobium fredii]
MIRSVGRLLAIGSIAAGTWTAVPSIPSAQSLDLYIDPVDRSFASEGMMMTTTIDAIAAAANVRLFAVLTGSGFATPKSNQSLVARLLSRG